MGGLLLVIVACLSAGAAVAARLARARRLAPGVVGWAALPPAVTRRTAAWRWAGVICGLVTGVAAAGSDALGRGLLLAAPVFGLCVLAGVLAGETLVRAPGGRTRTAALEVRRVRDYLPRGLAWAVTVSAAMLLALLTVTTATGAPDDLGRPGRILLLQCSAVLQQGAGPWPGSFYSVPLAAMVVPGLIAAAAALRVVIRRPRPSADPAAVAADDALRHRAAQAITGACGILIALPLAGTCFFTAVAVLSLSCRPAWWTSAGWALLALQPALVALMAWCAVSLLTPARAAQGAVPAR